MNGATKQTDETTQAIIAKAEQLNRQHAALLGQIWDTVDRIGRIADPKPARYWRDKVMKVQA